MKNIIFVIIFYIFISSCFFNIIPKCPFIPYVLERHEALGEINTKDLDGYERTFYIVTPEMLKRARGTAYLTYYGSIYNYYLFHVWVKCQFDGDEIHFFAVDKKYCVVENDKLIEYENGRARWRYAIISNGKCIVKYEKQVEKRGPSYFLQ